MVNWSWLFNFFSPKKPKSYDSYKLELDTNKKSIEKLMSLTLKLDEMDEDIRNNNNFLRGITNSLAIPIWVKDEKGRFLFVNSSCAQRILGVETVKEALSFTDDELNSASLATACMASDNYVRKVLKTCRFIEHARSDEGVDVWIDTLKSPLFMNNELIGIAGSGKEITENIPIKFRDRFSGTGALLIDIGVEYCFGDDEKDVTKKNHIINLMKNNVII